MDFSPAQRRVLLKLPSNGESLSLGGSELRSARVLILRGLVRAAG